MRQNDKNADLLTDTIGFGKWQWILYTSLIVPTKTTAIWAILAIIFMAPKTDFRCTERSNGTEVAVNSTCYKDCVVYQYSSMFDDTIISQWDLICHRKWLANFNQTVYMFGILIGSIVFGYFSDRYGRRPAILFACMVALISSIAAPFSPNFWTFTTIRFFLGIATAGNLIVPFTLMLEITAVRKRELVSGMFQMPFPVGEMVMPVFAYYLRSWNKFALGIAAPNVLFLIYFCLVPESPKWLISTGQLDKASKVMTNAAKSNKLPPIDMADVAKRISDESSSSTAPTARVTYLDLVRRRSVRMRNLCSCASWFILGLAYYGSNQYIGQTSSNVYLTVALAGGLQIPGIFIALVCCRRFGRRVTMIVFCIVCGISNGLLALPDEWFYLKVVVGTVGVSSASGAFTVMYMFTVELFPTMVRNMALGASSMASRVGSMIAPFVAGLGGVGAPAVFAVAPLVAAAACYCLPETRGLKLSDGLED